MIKVLNSPLSALIESHIQELADRNIAACSLGNHDSVLDDDILKHHMIFTDGKSQENG